LVVEELAVFGRHNRVDQMLGHILQGDVAAIFLARQPRQR
jgi:hypothetical protein